MSRSIRAGVFVAFAFGLPVVPGLAAEPAPASERLRELGSKLDSGTLSSEESRELLRDLTERVLELDKRLGAQPAPKPPQPVAAGKGDRVIAVYRDRNTTKLVIEARQPLVAGILVYVGPREAEVVLQDLLSRSERLYYYAASAPGRIPVDEGDAVLTQRTRVLENPSALSLKIKEVYTFEQKGRGEITAVQDGRAMIDRGTLHEVRERDIYKVLDASGHRKGFIEIRGIGDLQSSGVLYDRVEDLNKRVLQTAPGDRVVFLGQRKLFGLGVLGGLPLNSREEYGKREQGRGAGLVWNVMFKNGWGFEAFFGSYQRRLHNTETLTASRFPAAPANFVDEIEWKADYLFPMALKKNFFFPSVVSPYILAGGAYVNASLVKHRRVTDPPTNAFRKDEGSAQRIIPVLGAGLEAFPARLIRPRVDVKWFGGPTVRVADKVFRTDALVVSLGIFSAW